MGALCVFFLLLTKVSRYQPPTRVFLAFTKDLLRVRGKQIRARPHNEVRPQRIRGHVAMRDKGILILPLGYDELGEPRTLYRYRTQHASLKSQ